MNPRQLALFLCSYFYVLKVNAANMRCSKTTTSFVEPTSKKTSRTLLSCFLISPRPQLSWFDTIHYFDPTIPGDYFRHQLHLNRNTLSVLLNILCPHLRSQNVKQKNLRITELTGRFITRKTMFVQVVCKCRAPRQDDSTFEDLSLWTSFCAL